MTKFVVLKNVLYRCSLDRILLRCTPNYEIHKAMSEVHSSVCEAYQLGPKLYKQLKRLGNWPTMICDYTEFAKNMSSASVSRKIHKGPA